MPLHPDEQRELDLLELQELQEQDKPAPFAPGSYMAAAKKGAEAYQSPEAPNQMAGILGAGMAARGIGSMAKAGVQKGSGMLADLLKGPSLTDKAKNKLADLLTKISTGGEASPSAPVAPTSPLKTDLFSVRKR